MKPSEALGVLAKATGLVNSVFVKYANQMDGRTTDLSDAERETMAGDLLTALREVRELHGDLAIQPLEVTHSLQNQRILRGDVLIGYPRDSSENRFLFVASGDGFGCSSRATGRAVFGHEVETGDYIRVNRYEFHRFANAKEVEAAKIHSAVVDPTPLIPMPSVFQEHTRVHEPERVKP